MQNRLVDHTDLPVMLGGTAIASQSGRLKKVWGRRKV